MPGSTIDDLMRAPESHVRAILLALCDKTPIRVRALEHLDALRAASSEGGGAGQKRKAVGELKICVQCDQPFTEEENDDKACWYHWGETEVNEDDDFWADHDEDCHGTIDTEEMRDEFPDGFVWNCCNEPGSYKGCTSGKHEAHPDRSKKSSGVEPSESESEDDEDDEEQQTWIVQSYHYERKQRSHH